MSNTASYVFIGGSMYSVRVNGNHVYYSSSAGTASIITDRLNRIFSDPNRDLDFITPSYYNGCYVVCCPKVRKNEGKTTYLKDGTSVGMKIYENTIFNDASNNANQTAILTINDGSSNPWYAALTVANNIRNYIICNFTPLHGKSYIYKLAVPINYTSSISKTIAISANCQFFGEICQGVQNNDSYICTHSYFGKAVERISGVCTANGEVFHPMDLVAAMDSTSYSLYKNKYLKVTYGTKSIVVKVVTSSPPGKSGIELSFAAWKALGYPATDNGNLKIELMA